MVSNGGSGTSLHPAAAVWEPEGGSARNVEVSGEQLYGRACMVCGSQLDGLLDAGFVFTKTAGGGVLPWRVKACPHHTAEVAA